jgi:hypothetical protein
MVLWTGYLFGWILLRSKRLTWTVPGVWPAIRNLGLRYDVPSANPPCRMVVVAEVPGHAPEIRRWRKRRFHFDASRHPADMHLPAGPDFPFGQVEPQRASLRPGPVTVAM